MYHFPKTWNEVDTMHRFVQIISLDFTDPIFVMFALHFIFSEIIIFLRYIRQISQNFHVDNNFHEKNISIHWAFVTTEWFTK